MFPNPQYSLPLPPKPSIERYRKIAKDLVNACKSTDPGAIRAWADGWIQALVKLSGPFAPERPVRKRNWINGVSAFAVRKFQDSSPSQRRCTLTGAQFVIARSHGFESWPKFTKHLKALSREDSSASRFEAAADAIVEGAEGSLGRLLREEPDLVHQHSEREHGAALLHYVSANGVEGYRQKTPNNIVRIAEMLLDAGAEIDATTNVYGGQCTTLGLAATSVHPERAGVQEPLLQILLDRGADPNHPGIAGHGQSIVMACLANGRPKAAEFLANHGAHLDLTGAAALGRLDVVKTHFTAQGSLTPGPTEAQLMEGFLYACSNGSDNTVQFLLEKGIDLAGHSGDGQTGLHHAVIGGQLDTVKLLLRYNPPLEAENIYGGTVLGQALWSAAHHGDPAVYIEILEALVAAGAKLHGRHIRVNSIVDEWLERHGSHAEPNWRWYGEEPD